ncbi:unnamed protein product [Peronospora destructor]|uniref:Uncharacterized protein n=1 Tax=Peronospora destructor TaxID=86335 RepID=A0AAV0TGL0_9STRA|nr:unnamed protein product [Peronospora destructor]
MHSLRASQDFGGDSGGTSSSFNPFVKPVRPFGSGLSDGEVLGGTGGMRSSNSTFGGGQEAAKGFYEEGESRRSIIDTKSFGKKTQQMYRGGGMSSYLRTGGSNSPFRSSSTRTWPSLATEVPQPRRIINRLPGLPCPPGLTEPIGMQSRTGIRSGSRDMMQQRASNSQFRPFGRSTLSPFNRGDNVEHSLRDQIYDCDVLNSGLAELNTHSIRVDEMESMRIRKAVDALYNRKPTTSRRIDEKAILKTLRSPKEARDGRKKAEGRSGLRTKAFEFNIDAINVSAPGSPIIPKRSDRGCEMASSVTTHGNSLSVTESSRNRDDPSVTRGKRRNQVGDKDAALPSYSTGGNDSRWRKMANQSEEPGSMVSPLPGLKESDRPMKLASRGSGKSRRENTKSSSRTASRRNTTKRNDKGRGISRRQVYREKHDRESLGQFLSEETVPVPASLSRQKSQRNNDSPISSEANFQELEEYTTQDAEISAFSRTSESVPEVPRSINARIDDVDEAADKSMDIDKSRGHREILANFQDEVAAKRTEDTRSIHTARDAPPERPATTCTSSTKREPSLSSDLPEYKPTTRKELAEQAQVSLDQQLMESKKSKRKVVVSVEPPSESSSSTTNAASALCAGDEEKHFTKEHPKNKTKKEKVDKKKTPRGRKDKRGAFVISKAAETVNNSAVKAQDKPLETSGHQKSPTFRTIYPGTAQRSFSSHYSWAASLFWGTTWLCLGCLAVERQGPACNCVFICEISVGGGI